MISSDGWVDWAVRRPGPPNKTYKVVNSLEGLVCHSMEGWLRGSLGELDNPNRSASWHFSNDLDGTLYQHYSLFQCTWASGNYEANTKFIAIESAGRVDDGPLTDAQVDTMLRLAGDLASFGLTLLRGVSLFEHNEVATFWSPNSGPTSCPSHRYDAFFSKLQEDEMTPEEREEHQALVAIMGGREKLLANQAGGMDFILGYTQEQQKLADHLAVPHHIHSTDTVSGKVPEHQHRTTQQTIVTGEVIQ